MDYKRFMVYENPELYETVYHIMFAILAISFVAMIIMTDVFWGVTCIFICMSGFWGVTILMGDRLMGMGAALLISLIMFTGEHGLIRAVHEEKVNYEQNTTFEEKLRDDKARYGEDYELFRKSFV